VVQEVWCLPCKQASSPESKLQSHPKKKKKMAPNSLPLSVDSSRNDF
jgi:hypothetical protein